MVFFPGKGGCCGSLIIGNLAKSCRETQFGRLVIPPPPGTGLPPSHFVYVFEEYPKSSCSFFKGGCFEQLSWDLRFFGKDVWNLLNCIPQVGSYYAGHAVTYWKHRRHMYLCVYNIYLIIHVYMCIFHVASKKHVVYMYMFVSHLIYIYI